MTAADIWEAYCERNPKLRLPGESITLSVPGLRKLVDQVFAAGQHAGVPPPRETFTGRDPIADLFTGFRSKRPRE